MQDRRYRPGDVLDDYCPRERRITDHAIVAMIDDEIRRTRCGSCDAEHEYKEAKVPSPRRKTQPPALFNQVLENAIGPTAPHPAASDTPDAIELDAANNMDDVASDSAREQSGERRRDPAGAAVGRVGEAAPSVPPEAPLAAEPVEPGEPVEPADDDGEREGGFRRSLIRATFPRPDGQAPVDRKMPEFTIQSLQNRRNGQRHAGGQNKFRGGRRRPGGSNLDNIGPMRFRDHGHGQSQGQGNGQGQGGGRRRRGGKKNR
jgi:hypothetical protein